MAPQAGETLISRPDHKAGPATLADGRFDKRDFVYNKRRDEYRCPAGQRAVWRFTAVEGGLTLHKYCSCLP